MKINVKKCAVLRCTHSRSVSSIQHNYTLSAHEIAIKECHVYLCVEIDLKWSSHIQTISLPVFYFMKRNLYNCPADIKRTAYLTLFRPIMEYAAPVWDPYYNVDI